MSEVSVKITGHTEEVRQVDMNSSEAQYIMQKYFGNKQPEVIQTEEDPYTGLTFEEMVRMAQQKTPPIPQPPKTGAITFDSNNINYSESTWSDIDCGSETVHIKIDVVSDVRR